MSDRLQVEADRVDRVDRQVIVCRDRGVRMSDRLQVEADRVDRVDRQVIEQAAVKPGRRHVVRGTLFR